MTCKLNENNDRVLLHVHFDGSFRCETIAKFAQKRGFPLVSYDPAVLRDYFTVKQPSNLREFLSKFPEFLQCIAGDKDAIYQTAYEFIEDACHDKVCYVEARFCPQFLAGPDVTPSDVLDIVIRGFTHAGDKFGVKWGVIVTGIRECANYSQEIVELAKKFYGKGVVGVDAAGDEQLSTECGGTHPHIVQIFHDAKQAGIHRTVHAGENGPADSVREALDEMFAERIGHGYHVVDDPKLYERVKAENVHLEVCPTSSRLTGSVPFDWQEHPLHQFIRDGVNFSINTDDPLLNGFGLNEEYEIVQREFGLTAEQWMQINLNSANSAFVSVKEKQQLCEHIRKVNQQRKN